MHTLYYKKATDLTNLGMIELTKTKRRKLVRQGNTNLVPNGESSNKQLSEKDCAMYLKPKYFMYSSFCSNKLIEQKEQV